MKVVVVNDHLRPDGGADVAALGSARALAEAGHEVTVFAADEPLAGERFPFEVVSTRQSDLARGPALPAAWRGLWNRPAATALQALLSRHDPGETVVHVHSWTKALSSSVFAAAARSGFAQVLTLHEYFAVCPSGLLFNAQTLQPCELQPMSPRCIATHCDARAYAHKLYRVARHAVQARWGMPPERIDRYIVISRLAQHRVAPHLHPDARFALVRNPIEVGARPPPAEPARQRPVVMVARLFAPKGWRLFLEACRAAQVPALCVGEGPDREELARDFPEARFTGALDRAGVVAAMRSARALVLPSLWHETQGLVVAEAAAEGVPAIVSDRCGAAEWVSDGVDGLVVPAGELGPLTDAIRRVGHDPELARRLGAAAAERFWADPPHGARHAEQLTAVYREVLAERAGALGPETAVCQEAH